MYIFIVVFMCGRLLRNSFSAYDMFAKKYNYLIVNLVFSPTRFWAGHFFLIAPFPDHCLLVPFFINTVDSAIIYKSNITERVIVRIVTLRKWLSTEANFIIPKLIKSGKNHSMYLNGQYQIWRHVAQRYFVFT